MNNKVSIILPVYNGAKYVGRAIDSILAQSYRDYEVIIVNDCSTDNTLEIIREYEKKDSRIKVYSNATNQKLPRTLNNGFKNATGQYYTWTSDDNTYHIDAIEKMVNILDDNPNIDLVYTDYSVVDMNGNLIKEIKVGEPSEIRYRDIVGACFLYRRSLAEKVGEYDPDTFLAEDYDFFIRCYKESGRAFYHIMEDLYNYGRHDKNLSATRQSEIAHRAFDVMMKHFDFLYSECMTKEEQIRFFDALLFLLRDSKEKKEYRKKLYNISDSYKKYDFKRRIRKTIHKGIVYLPKKILNIFSVCFLASKAASNHRRVKFL